MYDVSGVMKYFSLRCLCHWVVRIWEQCISAGAGLMYRFLPCHGPTLIPAHVLSFLLPQTCSRLHACPVMSDSLRPHDGLPGFSLHGVFQARILEWVTIPPPGDLPSPGIKPVSLGSSVLHIGSLPLHHLEALATEFFFFQGVFKWI